MSTLSFRLYNSLNVIISFLNLGSENHGSGIKGEVDPVIFWTPALDLKTLCLIKTVFRPKKEMDTYRF